MHTILWLSLRRYCQMPRDNKLCYLLRDSTRTWSTIIVTHPQLNFWKLYVFLHTLSFDYTFHGALYFFILLLPWLIIFLLNNLGNKSFVAHYLLTSLTIFRYSQYSMINRVSSSAWMLQHFSVHQELNSFEWS